MINIVRYLYKLENVNEKMIDMAHAEKCPICYGTGNLEKEKYPYVGTRNKCHGCGGTGWVTVKDW